MSSGGCVDVFVATIKIYEKRGRKYMTPNKRNAAQAYKINAIKTASPARLTSMLYDAAVRFTDISIELMENDPKNYEEINKNL